MPIDFAKLQAYFDACEDRVSYLLGAKAPLGARPETIHKIDCSGWSRCHLFEATGVAWPDGSQNQLAYARGRLRKLAKYSDVQYAAQDPGRLFIAFLSPKPGQQWPRHVWEIWKGVTMESHSSGGVNSRPWNTSVLKNCKDCFEIV